LLGAPRFCRAAVLVFASLALAHGALVHGTARAEGEHQHDGLMLRFSLGLGPTRLSDAPTRADSSEDATSELSSKFAIDLGTALVEDLSLHARWSNLLGERTSGGVQIGLLGGGATYYWMDWNVYATAVLGIAYDVTRNAGGVHRPGDPANRPTRFEIDEDVPAEPGVGFDLELGYELWVSANWGIGPALQVSVRRLDYDGPGALWVTAWSLACSATYQ
jgi:hypothetical protein